MKKQFDKKQRNFQELTVEDQYMARKEVKLKKIQIFQNFKEYQFRNISA